MTKIQLIWASVLLSAIVGTSAASAKTNFLPDYQAGLNGGAGASANTDRGGGDQSRSCESYGFRSSQPDSRYTYEIKYGVAIDASGNRINCYANVRCKAYPSYTTCP